MSTILLFVLQLVTKVRAFAFSFTILQQAVKTYSVSLLKLISNLQGRGGVSLLSNELELRTLEYTFQVRIFVFKAVVQGVKTYKYLCKLAGHSNTRIGILGV